ncbi:hypothetical protein B9P82_27685 [Citrobacter sp. L55]|nr:hypothetical protein B9P82_27685 [Citrobacter sp. L55]
MTVCGITHSGMRNAAPSCTSSTEGNAMKQQLPLFASVLPAEMSAEAAGIAVCLIAYSHHACRTECDAMTEHYYRLRDYALRHAECSTIMHIID